MASKKHNRQYDLVVFGATGYTGKYTAEHITTCLPTDLKWAVAGRSRAKLDELVAECKTLNPDRRQPDIEICGLDDIQLATLAKKTFILISTVGPYGAYGEHAFKACAENGTHYLDVTGEVPFVARMIKKYEHVAKSTGSIMIPQIGIESAPADLVTLLLASTIKSEFATTTRDVTLSIYRLNSAPSGGTLATALSLLDNFSLAEVRDGRRPFALSPIPNPRPSPATPLLTRLTGLCTIPNLGLQTTSIAARTDAAIVERTWGLFSVIPSMKDKFYGPNFSFNQYMKARNWLVGIGIHYGITFLSVLLLGLPLFRAVLKRFVYQPGQGPAKEEAAKDRIEYRGVANPDLAESPGKQALCRAWFNGSMYYLTGVLLGEAALTILEDDINLDGGVYTPACLGQAFIDRLDSAGFKFEAKIIPA